MNEKEQFENAELRDENKKLTELLPLLEKQVEEYTLRDLKTSEENKKLRDALEAYSIYDDGRIANEALKGDKTDL